MRIALIGPGAVGGVVATWLAQTGRHDLTLCARRPLDGELHVETLDGKIRARPAVLTDPAAAGPVDWILVATKTYDAAGASAWFAQLGAGHARVAILQNGVEHRETFSPYLSSECIVPVVVDIPCERVGPTEFRQRGAGRLTVADDAAGREFAGLFAGTALEVALTPDFKTAAWRKLCLNAASVVSALTLQPAGIAREEAIGALILELAREVVAVGRAEGAMLDDAVAEQVLQRCRSTPPDAVNSLHADRIAGRRMEIDARNGVVVRLGRKHGIATPYNAMAVALLGAMRRA